MTRPVRLQLSRARGFSLQALSLATNGLPAVKVTRPGPWGNPFNFAPSSFCWLALSYGCRGDAAGRREASVKAFREWIAPDGGGRVLEMDRGVVMEAPDGEVVQVGERGRAGAAPSLDDVRLKLRGKNLACWCPLPAPGASDVCHAAVLIELANPTELP